MKFFNIFKKKESALEEKKRISEAVEKAMLKLENILKEAVPLPFYDQIYNQNCDEICDHVCNHVCNHGCDQSRSFDYRINIKLLKKEQIKYINNFIKSNCKFCEDKTNGWEIFDAFVVSGVPIDANIFSESLFFGTLSEHVRKAQKCCHKGICLK